jgi:hypothetical protein
VDMFQLPGEHGPMYASIGLAPSSGYQDEHYRKAPWPTDSAARVCRNVS